MKQQQRELFEFMKGHGSLPYDFEDIHICAVLGITYEELQRQPESWVENRMLYEITKAKVQSSEVKPAPAKK